jgi:mono/diheme cytochrome c family protein
MRKNVRSLAALALVVSLASTVASAQSSAQAIYKAKCQNCHGATGMADTTMARALKVKPVSDPEVAKISAGTMFEQTRDGVPGRMVAYKGKLTDGEIKDVVNLFRSFGDKGR